ncbi:MAG TPA: bifunctional diaminohydroxyphosphoribosylaminopyrimidine deaminase/5-amino-6-(5-phosphoribosylamino)uracil reductase RibD [Gemmatimonadales bacterium]|jgi:diaminohydroxyphosphoribosylaminopyrimidine deaminase/5-amino-6-(5-phosphoribosylamino)uracil reductase|nr:bifunctional diaminohydroxyphosphoribosylaminopyrimidine deaminase/5-amino-6-(5-phosphoribosylamino)uracil reductase RibD [Gemmatimonadales bacterium]
MNEVEAMDRALALALKGWGRVSPNPLVGAVLLKDGQVVGEGYHAEFGGPHAEAAALASCADPTGSTCVVTLEPCAHRGKTPPCTGALISAGVRRVVMALRDPNPEAGGGVEVLRRAGVGVEVGCRQEIAAALNAPFLWSVARPDRPFVALKIAASLDGFIADAQGRSQWISGEEAREYAHWLRAGFDAIGVGRRTADADDPQLTARGVVTPRVPPRRVVFARSGRVREDLRLVRTARDVPTIVVTSPEVRDRTAGRLSGTGAQVVGAEGVTAALRALRDLSIGSMLVEGGSTIAAELLAQDLVDRFYLIQAPVWLGSGMPAFGPRDAVPLESARQWVVTERGALGRDSLLVVDRQLCLPAS